jgi:predicted nucleotidyltransferase
LAALTDSDEACGAQELEQTSISGAVNQEVLDELSSSERATALKSLDHISEHPFLFAVVSGTHQYGFTSPDSDIDVRGAFVVPSHHCLGLVEPQTYASFDAILDDREVDCVAFEIGRYFTLVLNHSGNLIEELFSPLVIADGGYLEPIRQAVSDCLTRRVSRHYFGFFDACMKKLRKRPSPEVKTALYAARIALTGVTLLREGRVEAHLPTLKRSFGLDYIDEWIELKVLEHEPIPEGRLKGMIDTLAGLRKELGRAARDSILPDENHYLDALNDLLIRIRLEHL